ncbi:MAG: carbohydrate kinase family protein [Vicinamibacterales bacterium]
MRLPLLPALGPRRPFDMIALGLNSLDIVAVIPHHPVAGGKTRIERLATLPGGQSASAAVGCARLGWRTQYIGTFGDDDAARIGVESLERDQVDTSIVRRIAGATSHTSLVLVDARSGDRTVIWHRDPRLAMAAEDVPVDAVRAGRVLLVDDHEPFAATVAARAAREAGVRTVIDVEKLRPGTEELLQHIDIIIAAETFPSELTGVPDLGAALRDMARRFEPSLTCATLGPKGSLSLLDGKEVRTPAFDVHVEDTTGAGDAFRAGFIAAWLRAGADPNVHDVLRYAHGVAALNCRRLGARDGLPRHDEVEELIRRG